MSGCELRPHHALCTRFFRGRGYSEAFVENMARLVEALREDDPLVTLRSAADGVCRRCPHNDGGVCADDRKVAGYDAAVLSSIGLENGSALRWSQLSDLVRERVLIPNRLGEICGNCRWYAVCEKAADEETRASG